MEIEVAEEGPGIGDAGHLFVPFFTTKPHGSGIGLAWSRQIAAAHGGSLVLEDRAGGGAVARLRLPVRRQGPEDGPPVARVGAIGGRPR